MADFGKLAIGVRVGGMVDPSFFWCWTHLLRSGKLREGDGILNPAVGLPHAAACNVLVNNFLMSGCDSLMFIDDDMEFIPEAIDRLRADDHGFDILAALYCCRRGKHTPIVLNGLDVETGRAKVADYKDIKGVMPVRFIGFGGVIIKRWVIEELLKYCKDEPLFTFDSRMGEDGKFCHDASKIGAKIGVNTDVRFGHRITVAAYWNKENQGLDFSENDYGFRLATEKESENK